MIDTELERITDKDLEYTWSEGKRKTNSAV